MTVNLRGPALPAGATAAIHIDITAQANIALFVARQRVTQVVLTEISS